jgi:tetratricopeptide (TPR) repeat protein
MILANDRDSVLNVLERASTIYSRNPELEINYAFALRRGGQYDEAKKRLLSLVNVMIPFFVKYCFANAAFCAIHLSRYEEAVLLLEETMTVLKKEAPGETPELFSVPGIAIWVDRELAEEENFLKTSKLIDSALRSVIPYSSIPESVKQLASLYRQLGKQWPGSNSR